MASENSKDAAVPKNELDEGGAKKKKTRVSLVNPWLFLMDDGLNSHGWFHQQTKSVFRNQRSVW